MATRAKAMVWASIFDNPVLVHPVTFKLFVYTFTFADDDGTLDARSMDWLRTRLLPGLRIGLTVVEHSLNALLTADMLRSDIHDGITRWSVTNFFKYQKLRCPEGKGREKKRREGARAKGATRGSFLNGDTGAGPGPPAIPDEEDQRRAKEALRAFVQKRSLRTKEVSSDEGKTNTNGDGASVES